MAVRDFSRTFKSKMRPISEFTDPSSLESTEIEKKNPLFETMLNTELNLDPPGPLESCF